MDMNLLTEHQLQTVTVKMIEPELASEISHAMLVILPGWLNTQEARTDYAKAMQNWLFFSAIIKNEYVGLIAIEFATANNAHIKWISVKHANHAFVCTKLLLAAENYCYEKGLTSLTVETLSPKENDKNNQKTYHFFNNAGYKPLFEMVNNDLHHLIIYLQKTISLEDFTFIDLTHTLSSDVPHWGIDVGFKYNARYIKSAESTAEVQFRVQRLEMSSGIGTHMDAPSHCFEQALSINEIPIESLITVCRVIDVSSKAHDHYQVTAEDILHFENEYGSIPNGAFVIIYTGWDQRWHEPEKYRNNKIFPNITLEAAELLLAREIVGIGIDTLSPDAFGSDFPVHQLILGAGKYIIENVANAKKLDPIGCFIFALPIKIKDGTEAPMRLIGMKRKRQKF